MTTASSCSSVLERICWRLFHLAYEQYSAMHVRDWLITDFLYYKDLYQRIIHICKTYINKQIISGFRWPLKMLKINGAKHPKTNKKNMPPRKKSFPQKYITLSRILISNWNLGTLDLYSCTWRTREDRLVLLKQICSMLDWFFLHYC